MSSPLPFTEEDADPGEGRGKQERAAPFRTQPTPRRFCDWTSLAALLNQSSSADGLAPRHLQKPRSGT